MQQYQEEIKNQKKLLRRELAAKRDGLKENERFRYSELVVQQILHSEAYRKSRTIFSFFPMRSELRIDLLFPHATQDSKQLLFPVCLAKGHMEAYAPRDWRSMNKDKFGALSPDPHSDLAFQPQDIDLVLVPMLGFDRDLYRIGYGGGFYDRFLPRLTKRTIILGVAFSVQEVEAVPRDNFDIPLPAILTEKEYLTLSH